MSSSSALAQLDEYLSSENFQFSLDASYQPYIGATEHDVRRRQSTTRAKSALLSSATVSLPNHSFDMTGDAVRYKERTDDRTVDAFLARMKNEQSFRLKRFETLKRMVDVELAVDDEQFECVDTSSSDGEANYYDEDLNLSQSTSGRELLKLNKIDPIAEHVFRSKKDLRNFSRINDIEMLRSSFTPGNSADMLQRIENSLRSLDSTIGVDKSLTTYSHCNQPIEMLLSPSSKSTNESLDTLLGFVNSEQNEIERADGNVHVDLRSSLPAEQPELTHNATPVSEKKTKSVSFLSEDGVELLRPVVTRRVRTVLETSPTSSPKSYNNITRDTLPWTVHKNEENSFLVEQIPVEEESKPRVIPCNFDFSSRGPVRQRGKRFQGIPQDSRFEGVHMQATSSFHKEVPNRHSKHVSKTPSTRLRIEEKPSVVRLVDVSTSAHSPIPNRYTNVKGDRDKGGRAQSQRGQIKYISDDDSDSDVAII